jgi:transposase InsO family protein
VARVYRSNPALHHFYGQHPNRLPRGGAQRPNQVWVGDITYLPIGSGPWRFLAVVLDQYSRRVLAWTLGRRRDARLTRAVLDAAVRRRRPPPALIFHSDRGSEYAAAAFRERLVALGIHQSATQRGPQDNAHMESFLHSLKAEVIHGTRFTSETALRHELRRYIQYYNTQRLHSALGYQSPVDYESYAA